MKTRVHNLLLLLLPAALMGCSGEDAGGKAEETGKTFLGIDACFSRSGENGEDSSLVEDFGMLLLDDAGSGYPEVENPVHVTYDGTWKYPEVTLTERKCNLYAFSPFMSIPGKELSLSIIPQTDYLVSDKTVLDWQNCLASIEMGHLLSRLDFTIDGNDGCSLSIEDLPVSATYDLVSGKLSAKANGTAVSSTHTLLVFPGEVGGNRVRLQAGGDSYDWYLPAATLESGKIYGYSLNLSKEGELVLSGASVRPWEKAEDYTGTIKPNE